MLKHTQITVGNGIFHVVEAGSYLNSAVLFLHGWPEDWHSFEKVLKLAEKHVYALAIDLPGIGDSRMENAPFTKSDIANCIHELVSKIGLKNLTLVGHDVGGQVVYSYLRNYAKELQGAVIMNVAVPGVKPWDDVIRNPYIWHFSFHNVKDLPEIMVTGKERQYFDYFYQAITAHPERITDDARNGYVNAYSLPSALSTGFNWYRAFWEDSECNRERITNGMPIETPLLYLRGEHESGNIEQYVAGFKEAGITNVQSGIIPDSGHFAPEEQPEEVWKQIAAFLETNNMR
jgi:pimeloyl-ACP methyl ester carboxylesterase